MAAVDLEKPRRRRVAFSVRFLLGSIALLAIAIGPETNRTRQQKKAAEGIQRLGGRVEFRERSIRLGGLTLFKRLPAWLGKVGGPEVLREVESVHFYPSRSAGDSDLDLIDGLADVSLLDLNATRVGDSGLARLSGRRDIQDLSLDETSVDDAGLAFVAGLPNLRFLALEKTNVGDAGVAHLARLGRLETLDLTETKISDAGLRSLSQIPTLRSLDLHRTRVGDAAVEALKRARPNLEIFR